MDRDPLDHRISDAEQAAYAAAGVATTDRVVTIDDDGTPVQVRITETDGHGTPVVLLHGIASASVLFAPLVGALAGRRVIIVDWPGHGLSGTVRVDPRPGELRRHVRRVLAALLDGLGLDQVDLVGHSLGAQFGLYTALDQPERVRRLVTFGAPGAGLPGTKPLPVMRLMSTPWLGPAALSLPMSDGQFRKASAMALGAGVIERQSSEVYVAARLVAGRRANARGTASYFRALLRRGHVRDQVAVTRSELARVGVPVLMVWGDRDVFLTPDSARASISAVPDHSLLVLPAGHGPWLEHPDRAGRELRDFIG